MDQSLECCALVTPQSFVAGDLRGSLHLFSVNKKKPVFSVKVEKRRGLHRRTRTAWIRRGSRAGSTKLDDGW